MHYAQEAAQVVETKLIEDYVSMSNVVYQSKEDNSEHVALSMGAPEPGRHPGGLEDPVLVAEFQDLLAWRDRLVASSTTSYSQFRKP